jgi:hypothetical protein
MLGSRGLTGSGNNNLDRAAALTAPGQADWVDIDGSHRDRHCRSCKFFSKKRCLLFVRTMAARSGNRNFAGPRLPPGARACRKYEASNDEPTRWWSSSASEEDMPSIAQRYGKRPFFKADFDGDLVLQIAGVDLDQQLGSKHVDIVSFTNDDRRLVLNQSTALQIAELHGDDCDDWPGKWIVLFRDDTVEYENKNGARKIGGVRVRPSIPDENKYPAKNLMDDEIPY